MKLTSGCLCWLALTSAMAFGQRGYVGFDKDDYPGDNLLPALHQTFAFTAYWLNNPPGMQTNPWAGKREVVRAAGFGFLLGFNGRMDAQLQGQDAAELGRSDAADAAVAARREGFPAGAVIFLDQEEGGRLLPEQAAYLGAWFAAVRQQGFGAGVYASGIPVDAMSTAQDVAARFPGVELWVWDDRCPPAPGCVVPNTKSTALKSQLAHELVWQYAVTPRKPEDTRACATTYAPDNRCYAPGLAHSDATYIDLNVSSSADPSSGR
ncbi:MAG: glycoside hydrolase domain-containing protein [Acidobacteriaceae bacterium]